jgi:hypothetical protein
VSAVEDPALEVAKRNARLRAWRAHGVPVEGRWTFGPDGLSLALRCSECGRGQSGGRPRNRSSLREGLEKKERDYLRELAQKGCYHLALLSGSEPPEVRATLELELLAGD